MRMQIMGDANGWLCIKVNKNDSLQHKVHIKEGCQNSTNKYKANEGNCRNHLKLHSWLVQNVFGLSLHINGTSQSGMSLKYTAKTFSKDKAIYI